MEIFPYFAWLGLEARCQHLESIELATCGGSGRRPAPTDDTPDTSRFSIIMIIIKMATYELSITNEVQSQPTIKNFQAKPQKTGQS